jgi:hypothetical protein
MAEGNDGFFIFLLTRLAVRVPTLMVYLAGLVLALLNLRRHRTPAVLTLLGTGLLLLVSLTSFWLESFLLWRRSGEDLGQSLRLLTGLGFAAAILNALGIALILTAVFLGRLRPMPVAPRPLADPAPGEETRFTA